MASRTKVCAFSVAISACLLTGPIASATPRLAPTKTVSAVPGNQTVRPDEHSLAPHSGDIFDDTKFDGSKDIYLRGWRFAGSGIFTDVSVLKKGDVDVAFFSKGSHRLVAAIRPTNKSTDGAAKGFYIVDALILTLRPGERQASDCLAGRTTRIPFGFVKGSKTTRIVLSDGVNLTEIVSPGPQFHCVDDADD